jgi:hypothetical protein
MGMGRRIRRLRAGATLRAAAALLLIVAGCGPSIDDHVSIDLDTRDPAIVRVSVTSDIDSGRPRNAAVASRTQSARDLLLAGHDDWSERFARAAPENERVIWDRQRGVLVRAEHSGTIAAESLQRFFSDLPVTVQLTRGEGYGELTLYAGASTRATRQQREHFTAAVERWSAGAARYFIAVNQLYAYLNASPGRARSVFTQLYADNDEAVLAANDDERALIVGVRRAMDRLVAWEAEEEREAFTVAEEADLVLNPFPAEIGIHTPGEIAAMEGFVKRDAEHVAIPRPSLLDALASLEGKWITPDPFAAAMRAEREEKKDDIDFTALAVAPRKSLPVVASSEIAAALMNAMRPAARYRVRWVERR